MAFCLDIYIFLATLKAHYCAVVIYYIKNHLELDILIEMIAFYSFKSSIRISQIMSLDPACSL